MSKSIIEATILRLFLILMAIDLFTSNFRDPIEPPPIIQVQEPPLHQESFQSSTPSSEPYQDFKKNYIVEILYCSS